MTTATQTTSGLRVMISRDEIAQRVHEIAQQINKDYAGEKVVLVGVLKGSCLFLSDLARQISLDTTFDFISVSSYGQGKQSPVNAPLTPATVSPWAGGGVKAYVVGPHGLGPDDPVASYFRGMLG